MGENHRIIIAGGSGFIGRAVTANLIELGYGVTHLTRRIAKKDAIQGVEQLHWDGKSLGPWTTQLEGALAVINLSGHSVNCRHNAKNREAILHSRVDATAVIGQVINQSATPPRVWINASSIGFYGDTGNDWADENSPSGSDFLANVTQHWEKAQDQYILPRTRRVILRFGIVLDRNGGMLAPLSQLTKWGLGGAAGKGKQWVSWIHRADLAALIAFTLRENLCGVYNAVAPNPIQNRDFMALLRRQLKRPWSSPVPAPLVRAGAWAMQSSGDLALTSGRVRSDRLPGTKFDFLHPTPQKALEAIFDR